jgi:5'(3')-deoxyribonucleotidase
MESTLEDESISRNTFKMKIYRQYTIASSEDETNIANGRCPNYALTWNNDNSKHWPQGHDYFLGNGNEIGEEKIKDLRVILSEKFARGTLPEKLVFCDLDGVLADFNQGVKNKFNKEVEEIDKKLLWGVINKSNTFFENLSWMPKGQEFWNKIREYDPIILTGVPSGCKTAAEQKRKWCAKELGEDIHIITCATKDKPKYCLSKSILIDDRKNVMNDWKTKGGKFLLYSEDAIDHILYKLDKYMEKQNIGLVSP